MLTDEEIDALLSPCMDTDEPSVLRIETAIREAVRLCAERCAEIAEQHGTYPELNVSNGGPDWYKHGKSIAAAIREQAK